MKTSTTMKYLLFILLVFLFVDIRCIYGIHAVEKEEYDVLVKLARGIFSVSVNHRTRIEKNAIVKFWRAKGKFSVTNGKLFYDQKRVSSDRYESYSMPKSFASRIFHDLLAIYLNSNKQLVANEARNFLVCKIHTGPLTHLKYTLHH